MCLKQGEIIGKFYKITGTLGEGGFARTYLAEDIGKLTNSPCVVKEIRPPECLKPDEIKKRFEAEARTLEILGTHDQIPRLDKCFLENNKFYLIQEYIFGCDLSEELKPEKRFSEKEVIQLLQDILKVLHFVHTHQVIHRDIKPSNLMRRVDDKICLIDFGAVKEIGTLAVTPSGDIDTTIAIGTPGYMAPEQGHGNPRLNSDIYSVGIIGIQALTGLDPSKLPSDPQTGEKIWIYSSPDKENIAVSSSLERVLNKMVRYHFDQRYQSVTDVLIDLENITKSTQIVIYNPFIKKKSSIPLWVSGLAFLGILGGVLLGLSIFNPQKASQELNPITTSHSDRGDSDKKLKTTALINLQVQGDSVSEGEEILDTNSLNSQKERGVRLYAEGKYKEALSAWQNSWAQASKKDPETLIYLNNAFLETQNAEYYTLAVVVPVNSKPSTDIRDADLAKEIMRGIAQAQTEVNLSLENAWEELPGEDFLPKKEIRGKGLKIVIADDVNIAREAEKRAETLVKREDLLGVVGHYTSEMTLATVDIYDRNKLVLISPGSVTEDLSKNPRDYFFRTVPNIGAKAEYLARYLINSGQKRAAVFYNPHSPYTRSFWEEFDRIFQDKGGTPSAYDFSHPRFDATKAIKEVGDKSNKAIVLFPDGQVTHTFTNSIQLIKANNGRHWIAGGWALYSPRILEIGDLKSFDRFVISVPWHHMNSPNHQFPLESYQLWKGIVSPRTALTYDAIQALIRALKKQDKPTREGMQKTLADFDFIAQGASGTIKFDRQGDRYDPPVVLVKVIPCANQQYGLSFVPLGNSTCEQ